MNNINEETKHHGAPAVTSIYRPAPSGKGSAISISMFRAVGGVAGHALVEMARQKPVCGETAVFDWGNSITAKLCADDLAQVLMVFCGMQESIDDGKGIYHRTTTANTCIRFCHMIEPVPHYALSVRWHPHGGEADEMHFSFRPSEAVWLSAALEAAMGAIVFGI